MSVIMFIFGVISGTVIGALAMLAGRLQTEIDKASQDGDRR
jgi:hypothetical protein